MNEFARDINATIAIAAREIMNFTRNPSKMVVIFIFPIIFLGVLGGNLQQNLGSQIGFDFMPFIFFGIVVSTLYQTSFTSVTSLIEDRENDFTQEIFVAPISRYAMILGKVIGGTFISLFSLLGLIFIALLMQIKLSVADISYVVLMWPLICISGGALGILFISIVNDSETADTGSFMVIIPQIFLAGIITPLTQSSGLLSALAHIMPMTYLADLVRNIVYSGKPEYSQIVLYNPLVDLLIIAGMSFAFLFFGTMLFTRSSRAR